MEAGIFARGLMNGFITESVSKIADGFGSALKLLAFMILSTLAFIPLKAHLGVWGIVALLALLLILSLFYFYRSFNHQFEDKQKAWCGMAAGALLWQVTRYLPEIPGWGWVSKAGIIYWAAAALLTLALWKHVLNVGGRLTLLTFLLNWIGGIYLATLDNTGVWPQFIAQVYTSVHYLGIIGILISIWWIVMRSRNSLERKYGGLALYFFVLFTFLFF
jgi:hypothetical protein